MNEDLLTYRELLPEDYNDIVNLLNEISWDSYPFKNDPGLFNKFLDNTDRSVVALEGSQILGIATAICNDVSIGYVTMIAVSADKQGYGIGSKMIKLLIGNDPNIKWVLSSKPENDIFWNKQGFIRNKFMVRERAISTISRQHTDTAPEFTFKRFILNLLSHIYTLNIHKCHQGLKHLIQRMTKRD